MNTCKTCSHFSRGHLVRHGDTQFGACRAITDEVTSDPKRAYAWDYEEYNAGLTVGEDFGCTLWEAKR